MYMQTMERIDSQMEAKKTLAKQTLAWVTCSKRALTPQELRYALAIDEWEQDFDDDGLVSLEDIVSSCQGLVVINPETDTVRLVHYTAQEFFTGPQGHLNDWNPGAELYITTICLTILNFEAYDKAAKVWCSSDSIGKPARFMDLTRQNFGKLPFLRYAAFFWPQHLRGVCNKKLIETTISFLEPGARFQFLFQQIWFHFYELIPFPDNKTLLPDEEPPLHTCAILGLDFVYKAIFESIDPEKRLFHLNRTVWHGNTALFKAARMNRADVVLFLVEQKGIDVTLSPNGYTPLGVACSGGHEKVVAALLKHPDLSARTLAYTEYTRPGKPLERFDLPIHLATKDKRLGVIRLLVEDDNIKADVNAKNGDGKTPLHIACDHRCEEMVAYLLGREGLRVNDQTKSGATPFLIAATNGSVPILRRFCAYCYSAKISTSSSVCPTARRHYTWYCMRRRTSYSKPHSSCWAWVFSTLRHDSADRATQYSRKLLERGWKGYQVSSSTF